MINVPAAEKSREDFGTTLGPSAHDAVLHSDYEYIDSLLGRVEAFLQQGLYGAARRQFDNFREALERHMLLEERTAFPIYERLAKSDALTTALRSEHDSLRQLLDRTSLALRAGEGMCWDALSDLCDIHEILGPHSEKEEALVFSNSRAEPNTDRQS